MYHAEYLKTERKQIAQIELSIFYDIVLHFNRKYFLFTLSLWAQGQSTPIWLTNKTASKKVNQKKCMCWNLRRTISIPTMV